MKTNTYILLILFLQFIITSPSIWAQNLLEDSNGETTIFLNQDPYGLLRFNSSSSSVSIGYNRTREVGSDFDGDANLMWGTDLKAKVKDSKGTLISGNQINPGLEFNFLIGRHRLNYDSNLDRLNGINAFFIRAGIRYDQFETIDTISSSLFSLDKKKILSLNMLAHLNWQFRNVSGTGDETRTNYIQFLGVAFGYKDHNDFEDLTKASILTTFQSNSTQTLVKEEEGRIGPINEFGRFVFNADYGFIPRIMDEWSIGLNLFFRGEFFGEVDYNVWNSGLGFFFVEEGSPSSVQGGIACHFKDMFNGKESDKDFFERSTIYFYVGYNIN